MDNELFNDAGFLVFELKTVMLIIADRAAKQDRLLHDEIGCRSRDEEIRISPPVGQSAQCPTVTYSKPAAYFGSSDAGDYTIKCMP